MAKRRLVIEVDCARRWCGNCDYSCPVSGVCELFGVGLSHTVEDNKAFRCHACLAAEVKEPSDG